VNRYFEAGYIKRKIVQPVSIYVGKEKPIEIYEVKEEPEAVIKKVAVLAKKPNILPWILAGVAVTFSIIALVKRRKR